MHSPAPAAARDASAPNPGPNTVSLWMRDVTPRSLPPLDDDLRADVCIVGAGIAGLTLAYELARSGTSVVVLDGRGVGHGETARTSAHLSNVLDARYADLEKWHGADGTPLIAESHAHAIDEIERISRSEHIACGFRRVPGYLFARPDDDPERTLEPERAAAERAGLDVAWVDRAPLGTLTTGKCLSFPDQAIFHPLRYLAGLADAVERHGGRLLGGHVEKFDSGATHVTTTDGHGVTAGALVIATNTPINDLVTMHSKQAAYRTYVIAAPVPIGTVPPGLYWDTDEPYHYVRTESYDAAHDLILVGGEDHHTGDGARAHAPFERLEAWAHARLPELGPVRHRWSGQIMASVDGLGFIGPNPGDAANVFIATGDTGNGLTNGTIAGILLADLIAGRPNPWKALYDPARITPRAAWNFARESLHVASGYARWLTPARSRAHAELAPGHGAVFQRGLGKVAVYRDERGALHELSAVCPHLGGVVQWNDVEKSWDCPCHGSRFDTNGCVLNGPAAAGLERT